MHPKTCSTYHSYSSIPIEQESGPRAAQRQAVWRTGDRGAVLGKREERQDKSTLVRCKAQRTSASEKNQQGAMNGRTPEEVCWEFKK